MTKAGVSGAQGLRVPASRKGWRVHLTRGLASVFAVLALGYGSLAMALVHFDAEQAEARFEDLRARGEHARAIPHGERVLDLAGAQLEMSVRRRLHLALADAYEEAGAPMKAAAHLKTVLDDLPGGRPARGFRAAGEYKLARVLVKGGRADAAARRLYPFLETLEHGADGSDGTIDLDRAKAVTHAMVVLHAAAPAFLEGDLDALPLTAPDHEAAPAMLALAAHFRGRDRQPITAARLADAGARLTVERYGPGDPAARSALILAAESDLAMGFIDRAVGRLALVLAAESDQGEVRGLSYARRLMADAQTLRGNTEQARRQRLRVQAAAAELLTELLADETETVIAPGPDASLTRPISSAAPLPVDYRPFDLVSAASFDLPVDKPAESEEMRLRLALPPRGDPVAQSLPARLGDLLAACRSATGEPARLRSAFRSFETQRLLFERRGEGGEVAPPGASEHQSGLAVDINLDGRFLRESDPTYACLREEAHRHGFLLSYPPGNRYLGDHVAFEPWHWRYVGRRAAVLYRVYGALDRPLEFLGNLGCYERLARAGADPTEADTCLERQERTAALRQGYMR